MRRFIQIVWGGITMLILTAVLANADTIFVDSIDDVGICDCGFFTGCCNLRYAIAEASTGDTITFREGLAGSTITLYGGQLTIDKHLTIDGDLDDDNTPDITISGNDNSRVFFLNDHMIVTLDGLIIRDGNPPDGGEDEGGGIYIGDGNFSFLKNCHIVSNYPGPTSNGGGIYNGNGSIFIDSCFISYNEAYLGGAISNYGTTIITNSTFYNNRANNGGGIFNHGTVNISQTTFHLGIAVNGAAILNYKALTLKNCTLSNNQADYGGGIWNYTMESGDTLVIANSTFYSNGAQPNQGGGIYLVFAEGGNGEHITNTIIAGNSGDDCRISFDTHGTLETNANNLIQDGTCSPSLSGDPLLGDLTDNGGLTLTHALLSGSRAINAGSNAHVSAGMTTDQRGTGYPRIQNGIVDIGAFEYYEPMMMFPIRTPDGKTTIITF